MVLPLYDDNTDRQTTPWVNYALIGLNVFVFIVLQQFVATEAGLRFTYAFSLVPEEIRTGRDIHEEAPQPERVAVATPAPGADRST